MSNVEVIRPAYDEVAVHEHADKARAKAVSDEEAGTTRRTYSREFKLMAIEAHGRWSAIGGFKAWCGRAGVPMRTAMDWSLRPERDRNAEPCRVNPTTLHDTSDHQPEAVPTTVVPSLLTTPTAAPTIADPMDDVEGLVYRIKALLPTLTEDELDDALNEVDDLWEDIGARLQAIEERQAVEAMA